MAIGRYAHRYSHRYYAAPRNYLKGYRSDSEGHRLAALGGKVPWAKKYQRTYQQPRGGLSFEAERSLQMMPSEEIPTLPAPPMESVVQSPIVEEISAVPGASFAEIAMPKKRRMEPLATPGTPPGPATGFDLL
jgi:hypothetical protein